MFDMSLFWIATIPVGLILRIFLYKFRVPLWLQIIISFPGTIAHELAHLVIALVFNAKPVGFSIIPKKEGDKWALGAVTCKNIRWYNAFPVAMAPLLLVVFPFFFTLLVDVGDLNLLEKNIYFVLLAVIVKSTIPSTQDFKIVFKNFIGSFVWVSLIFSAIYYS